MRRFAGRRFAGLVAAAGLIWAAGLCWAPLAGAHTVTRPLKPAAGGAGRPAGYRLVVDELRAWDLPAAGRVLARLRKASPGLPEWDALEGAAAYLGGRYARAIALLNEALRRRSGDREWLELRLHVRQTQSAVEGFRLHRTPHFDISYDAGVDAILPPYLGEALETARRVLGGSLGVRPAGRVRVEVFSDPGRFRKASTLSRRDIEEKGAVGISKFNKLMILSPGALLRGYRWLDTAAHEYVHYLIVRGTRNLAPIWLHEGVAKYLEKRWRVPAGGDYLHPGEVALLARARESGAFISFQRMEPSLIYLDTPQEVQLAYAEAASAAAFIQRRAKPDGLARLLRAIGAPPSAGEKASPGGETPSAPGEGAGEGQAARPSARRASLVELEAAGPPQSAAPGLKALFGLDLDGFEKAWLADLRGRPLKAPPGAVVAQPRLRPEGPLDERSIDLAALKSAVARRRTRLGDRLSFRRRLRAALAEYRRALRDEPHAPALLNRMARIEIQLGLLGEAKRHLARALELDPDYVTTHVNRAVAFEREGRPGAARRAWEEVIQINPFIPASHTRLAELYARAGERKKAERERKVFRALRGL